MKNYDNLAPEYTGPVYWLSPLTRCDMCGSQFHGTMYDARVQGCWGNVCHSCFTLDGGRLGTGLGQKYELQGDGRWLKVAG